MSLIFRITLVFGIMTSIVAHASNESGNGGFAYAKSYQLLRSASECLVRDLPTLAPEVFEPLQIFHRPEND